MSSPAARRFERTELPRALQPQLRLYRRLYLARIDLEEANAIVEDLLARRIMPPRSKLPSALLLAMNTALVVSYARPFVLSRGQSEVAEKAVPGVILRSLTAREREMHEALITMRNKEVAHSDAEILEMSFEVFEGGDGAIFKHVREPFKRPALQGNLNLVRKLGNAIHQKCEELGKELPNNVWL